MLEFLVDNIFVVFVGKVFQQIVGIPIGTNCALLLADIFLYSYEAEFIQSLLSTGRKQRLDSISHTGTSMIQSFRITWARCIPFNSRLKTRQRATLLLLTWIYFCRSGGTVNFTLPLFDKRDDFNFHITNFPFLNSNIPTSPAYGVFISQLIRYARACSSYGCFILRATRLSNKLLEQGYVKERLESSLRKFYGRYGNLIKQYEVSLSQMLNDIL